MIGEERCARIPTDYFLALPVATHSDSNSPETGSLWYDWASHLDQVLHQPLGTTVTTPEVDFDRLVRRSPTGGLAFVVRLIMVTDAFVPHPAATVRIRLDGSGTGSPGTGALDRDVRWGSRVIDRWERLESTWNDGASVISSPDLDLSGEDPIERNAGRVAGVVKSFDPRSIARPSIASFSPWIPVDPAILNVSGIL